MATTRREFSNGYWPVVRTRDRRWSDLSDRDRTPIGADLTDWGNPLRPSFWDRWTDGRGPDANGNCPTGSRVALPTFFGATFVFGCLEFEDSKSADQ
jgi:hypothetical protein